MPVHYTGPVCARPGCQAPVWKDRLCAYCWRFARVFEKDAELLAYQPLNGYRDEKSAVSFPWESWEQDARARGKGLADLFAEAEVDRERPAD